MSKRAPQFERRKRDYYPTPLAAVPPLRGFIPPGTRFFEPCAGDGALARELVSELGLVCTGMVDLEPVAPDVMKFDMFRITNEDGAMADCFITNPPWDRPVMHAAISHLKRLLPTWLLIESDWLFTKQAAPLIPDATHIVSIGRLKWIPGSPFVGKDNCCWVRFLAGHGEGPRFYPNL